MNDPGQLACSAVGKPTHGNAELEALAIHGGRPTRSAPMPVRKALGEAEIASLMEAIAYYRDCGIDVPYQGRFEQAFCEAYAELMGGGYADAVATGTGAVFVALEALAPLRGSEVIISPVTDAGPLNCILYQGCIPVVADAMPDSYNAGIEQILDKVSERTSVVLAVHCAGEPLAIDGLVAAMHERGIKVLEDCSQAPGARYNGRRVGTFGDIAATSTMYRKSLMTGSSGGLVYTRDIELHRRALACADRGKPSWRSDYDLRQPGGHMFPALNWNTDELSCAIGLASVRRLDDVIASRMAFVRRVTTLLEDCSRCCRAYVVAEGASPFFLPIWVDQSRLSCDMATFARALQAEGIDLNPHYNFLIADWEWAKAYIPDGVHTPNALAMRDRSFNLFLNEHYGVQEAHDVAAAVVKVERYFGV